ncbi:uncharacterized protein C8A04DRAFT_25214 [Dichotomopilus funicola]|uniref:AMP-activated protein kinase glycogen-binding domain-containing protein n=1 Tax=Dichotomopilus funicola TaxID=1934379 RepID=A0AAN6V9N1_9PEZI|nr:hypothetical protein C8A04DRAFT_25214 [Dichotomopilus funicola]
MTSTQVPVVINYYKPGTEPPVYIAGTFSDPPWIPHQMEHIPRDDGEYNFKKEVCGEPGSTIQYKFRIGTGDWWVLKEDEPTVTDDSGNTNHVLEVGVLKETFDGVNQKATPKHLEPPGDRSGTGTSIEARVAAEVADSAELLHEGVPKREQVQDNTKGAEKAVEEEPPAKTLNKDRQQGTIFILDPPPGERPLAEMQPRDYEFHRGHDEYIADKSPLFAHERVGMYQSDEEEEEEESPEEESLDVAPQGYAEAQKVDFDDPTLERFPSDREEIIDAVRHLSTGLPIDDVSFDAGRQSPVVNPSRRGTEVITGDFSLSPPGPKSGPSSRRSSRKSPRGSLGSHKTTSSLHSISENEEQDEEELEEQTSPRPAVVFTNPLGQKPKPRRLTLSASDEDEGVALREGISPRTVRPKGQRITTPPMSPRTGGEGGPAGGTSGNSKPADADAEEDNNPDVQPYDLDKNKFGSSVAPKRSQAEVAAPQPTEVEDFGHSERAPERKEAAPQPAIITTDTDVDFSADKPSYAEVVVSKPSSSDEEGTQAEGPGTQRAATGESSGSETEDPGRDEDGRPSTATTKNLRRRSVQTAQKTGETVTPSSHAGRDVPFVRPKWEVGWIKTIFRAVFVGFLGGIVNRVMKMLRLEQVVEWIRTRRGVRETVTREGGGVDEEERGSGSGSGSTRGEAFILQFRPPRHKIDLDITKAARTIWGELVPVTRYVGVVTAGGSEEAAGMETETRTAAAAAAAGAEEEEEEEEAQGQETTTANGPGTSITVLPSSTQENLYTGNPTTLIAYTHTLLPGTPLSSLYTTINPLPLHPTLPKPPNLDPELPNLHPLLKALAKSYFAPAFRASLPPSSPHLPVVKRAVGWTVRRQLRRLERGLPERFKGVVRGFLEGDVVNGNGNVRRGLGGIEGVEGIEGDLEGGLEEIEEGLPWVLTHGDFIGGGNVLVDVGGDESDGGDGDRDQGPGVRLTGLVDWAEGEWLPFGVGLYGIEEVLGRVVEVEEEVEAGDRDEDADESEDGQEENDRNASATGTRPNPKTTKTKTKTKTTKKFEYLPNANALRATFWEALTAEIPELADPVFRRRVEKARVLGLLLWYGIAFDDGALNRVAREREDDGELQKLDLFMFGSWSEFGESCGATEDNGV